MAILDTRGWFWMAGLAALATAGCGADPEAGGGGGQPASASAAEIVPAPAPPSPLPPPPTAADSAGLLAALALQEDSLRAAFDGIPRLTPREVAELRQDRNAEQIATARTLGARVSGAGEIARLTRSGRLLPLADSTDYWILRDLDHSVPYVTPEAHALLVELGRRFHARLERAGIPRYRMKVTSVLRTDETQADLRRVNANASRTVSAHEFGTTIDVSHERFAVPAPDTMRGTGRYDVRELREGMLERVEKDHSRALQAELGRAIQEMRGEGALHVMMEDAQPVYHMTVARRDRARG